MTIRLTMMVLLASCAGAIAADDVPPAAAAAQDAWLRCRTEQAAALDDGISDARSIGVAVAQACRPWREQMNAALGFIAPAAAARSLDNILAGDVERCTMAVLQARRARRAAPPAPAKPKPKGEGI